MSEFFRFPSTPHLAWLGPSPPRDDKVLARNEAVGLLDNHVTVEEKLDGANLGISLDPFGELRFQNRGQFLRPPFSGQFARLTGWAGQHCQSLATVLQPGLTLFGEWLAARHSLRYDKLPDWFVAFDVHDAGENAFWSAARRDNFVQGIGLAVAPCLVRGRTNLAELERLVINSRSKYGDTALEGVVVRQDNSQVSQIRGKLVRPDFVQSIEEHWRRRSLDWNQLDVA